MTEGTTAVTTTPSSAAPESTSAPATTSVATPTTSSTAIAPGQRPTFAQAFAADAATQDTDATTQPEAATTQPVDATDPQSAVTTSTDKQGPVPLEVHTKALENARVKAVETFRQTAGVDKAVELSSRINASATGFWREYTTELLAHPEHGAALRSDLARMFGGLRQPAAAPQAAPQADPMPKPDVQIVDAQGNVTGMTYSAEQLEARETWRENQREQQRQSKEQSQKDAEAAHAAMNQRIEQTADEYMADAKEVLEITDATPKEQSDALFTKVAEVFNRNPGISIHRAALIVRKNHIVPAQAGKAQAQVLESLKTKAAAQSVNPAGAVPASTHRPKSFMDKALQW